MKLLIITQVVDKKHPVLGFFHRWIEEFAKHVEVLHVICLEEGTHELPANVHVHSLGKEVGKTRLAYFLRFYRLIISLRNDYDQVFVHMNQIYVLLGAPVWKLFRKQVSLWYMHGATSASLTFAEKFADTIYTGSKESFPLKSSKVVVTGHGIDTVRFAEQTAPKTLDLITVGRITESKNLHTLIKILSEIRKSHKVTLTIVGQARTEQECLYEEKLKAQILQMELNEAVLWRGGVEQSTLPEILRQSRVFVTMAQNGSLDKAILEAMACGLPVVAMAPGAAPLPLTDAYTTTPEDFVIALKKVLESGVTVVPEYTTYIQKEHSLATLIPKLLS